MAVRQGVLCGCKQRDSLARSIDNTIETFLVSVGGLYNLPVCVTWRRLTLSWGGARRTILRRLAAGREGMSPLLVREPVHSNQWHPASHPMALFPFYSFQNAWSLTTTITETHGMTILYSGDKECFTCLCRSFFFFELQRPGLDYPDWEFSCFSSVMVYVVPLIGSLSAPWYVILLFVDVLPHVQCVFCTVQPWSGLVRYDRPRFPGKSVWLRLTANY